jgi:hypothetical protein
MAEKNNKGDNDRITSVSFHPLENPSENPTTNVAIN